MKQRYWLASILFSAFAFLGACSEGEYNNLDCDAGYVPECLDTTHIMMCINGKLIVSACEIGQYCHVQNAKLNQDGSVTPATVFCDIARDKNSIGPSVCTDGSSR